MQYLSKTIGVQMNANENTILPHSIFLPLVVTLLLAVLAAIGAWNAWLTVSKDELERKIEAFDKRLEVMNSLTLKQQDLENIHAGMLDLAKSIHHLERDLTQHISTSSASTELLEVKLLNITNSVKASITSLEGKIELQIDYFSKVYSLIKSQEH